MHMHLKDAHDHDVMATVVVTARDAFFRVRGDVVAQFDRSALVEWLFDPVEEITDQRTTLRRVPDGVALEVQDAVPMKLLGSDVLRRLKVTLVASGRVFPLSRLPS